MVISAQLPINLVIFGKLPCNFRFAGCMWKINEPIYTEQYIFGICGHIEKSMIFQNYLLPLVLVVVYLGYYHNCVLGISITHFSDVARCDIIDIPPHVMLPCRHWWSVGHSKQYQKTFGQLPWRTTST